jgi:hypothetical protein
MSHPAELGAMERKGAGPIGCEFQGDGFALRQFSFDVEFVQLEPVIPVCSRQNQPNAISAFHRDGCGRELVFPSRHFEFPHAFGRWPLCRTGERKYTHSRQYRTNSIHQLSSDDCCGKTAPPFEPRDGADWG